MKYSRNKKILVAGLGNILLKDDGIGIHVMKEIERDLPKGVISAEIGTSPLRALHLFEESDKILAIDAVRVSGVPGTIYFFSGNNIYSDKKFMSLHELGLLNSMQFIKEEDRPSEICILGIEPEIIDYGLELSQTLQKTIAKAAYTAKQILKNWINNNNIIKDIDAVMI